MKDFSKFALFIGLVLLMGWAFDQDFGGALILLFLVSPIIVWLFKPEYFKRLS